MERKIDVPRSPSIDLEEGKEALLDRKDALKAPRMDPKEEKESLFKRKRDAIKLLHEGEKD